MSVDRENEKFRRINSKTSVAVVGVGSDGINGGPLTFGTTATEIAVTGTTKAISILADAENTGKVWFGASDVDNTGANAFGRLTADRAITIELDDSTTALYIVSDTVSQKAYIFALT